MKKNIFLFLIILLSYTVNAQDYIVVGEFERSTVKGKILESDEGYLKYIDSETGDSNKIFLETIVRILFGEIDEIYFISSVKKKYIPCYIESIGVHNIRYIDFETGGIVNINKDFMFACHFGDSCNNQKFEDYFSVYNRKVLEQNFLDKLTIVKKNSTVIDVMNIAFKNSIVTFSILDGEQIINTSINQTEIAKIYSTSKNLKPYLDHGNALVLSRLGSINNNCTINSITDSQLSITIQRSRSEFEYFANKGEVCALFFYDWENEWKKINDNIH